MKPHKHAELIKAWADGAEIEQACRNGVGEILWYPFKGTWSEYYEYRIKPEPKPDKFYYLNGTIKWDERTEHISWKVTLDEVGNIKSAEVLK